MKQMWSKEEIEKVSKATPKDISLLVDSAGNPRFIEGDGTPLEQEGVTNTYCKWSLSGTHLMLVYAGTIANTTTLENNVNLATFDVPSYIWDKIYPVWLTNIEAKSVDMYAQDWTKQTAFIKFAKSASKLTITMGTALTLTAERSFRVQFDLLIDAE